MGAASFISSLKDGYETMLNRQFEDGTELPIGEWQKIALAPTFLSPAQILVQGEPTSSWTPRQRRVLLWITVFPVPIFRLQIARECHVIMI